MRKQCESTLAPKGGTKKKLFQFAFRYGARSSACFQGTDQKMLLDTSTESINVFKKHD